MQTDKKLFLFFVLVAILFPFLGNLLIVQWAFLISPLVFSLNVNLKYMEVMEPLFPYTIGLPMLFSFFVMYLYLKPLLKYFYLYSFCEKEDEVKIIQRRIINYPTVISLYCFVLWLFASVLGETVFTIHIWNELSNHIERYLTGVIFGVLNAFLSFVLFYYSLEYLNRKLFIPVVFHNSNISSCKGTYSFTIAKRFKMFYGIVFIYPISILSVGLFRLSSDASIEQQRILFSLFTVIIIASIAGMIITFLLASLFKNPIKDISLATERIKENNYNEKIQIYSNDEIGLLAESFNRMSIGLKEKDWIKDVFGKMVDPGVRDYLLSKELNLGGESKVVTILFSDIRNFTTLSEKMKPTKIVEMLNYYFDKMGECVSKEKGLVNKYIGDAIMAIFGTPIELLDHPDAAVKTALAMRTELEKVNLTLSEKGFPKLDIGIGIHTGEVLAGNIGSKTRMEYTVIGDSVNLASRIEGLCKQYKKNILLSESTVSHLSGKLSVQFVDSIVVKGKTVPIKIYSI
jgi:adenylate cyclase